MFQMGVCTDQYWGLSGPAWHGQRTLGVRRAGSSRWVNPHRVGAPTGPAPPLPPSCCLPELPVDGRHLAAAGPVARVEDRIHRYDPDRAREGSSQDGAEWGVAAHCCRA